MKPTSIKNHTQGTRRNIEIATASRRIFAQKLRQARKAGGWTQKDIEQKTGLHRSTVSDIERGVHNVTIDNMHRLATAVGCRVRDLL